MQYKIHYQVWGEKKPTTFVPTGRPQENGEMPKTKKTEPV